jgi:hypothetical protein
MIPKLKNGSLLLIAIFQITFLFSQKNNVIKRNQIKFTPFHIIDLVNPGVELSYEKSYATYFSSQLSISYLKDLFKTTPFKNYNGYRLSFEQKRFIKEKGNRLYYSGELAYLNVNYASTTTYAKDTQRTSPSYIDTFNLKKQTLTFNLKLGFQIPLKRFVIDVSAGLGIKYKITERSNIDDINAYELLPQSVNAYRLADKGGKYFMPNVPISIKIGYHF